MKSQLFAPDFQEHNVPGGFGLQNERLLKVTVLGIAGGKVRLGFEVDSDVPVHRAEVWERARDSGPPASGE